MDKTIEEISTLLKLPYIRKHYKEEAKEALLGGLSYEEFLGELLEKELENRAENSIQRKIARARFPNRITFESYQTKHLQPEVRMKIRELETLDFIENHENIILVGNPGVGKTALSICLGMEACFKNKTVLFINIPNLLIELREAMSRNQITAYKRKFEKYDLVILDELGYISFDQESAEIMFNLLSNRTDKKSVIITSNLPINKWVEVFKDVNLTTALVDRLAFKAHLIDMSGESYRTKTTKEWAGQCY